MTPKPKPRKDTRLAGLEAAYRAIERFSRRFQPELGTSGWECLECLGTINVLIRAERRRKRGRE